MSQPMQIGILPPDFSQAIHDLSQFAWDQRIHVSELDPPARLAPYSAAIDADIESTDDAQSYGRLILLHDPKTNESWNGTFRCVTFARAEVSPEMANDPFLASVGWSWLTAALEAHHARYTAPSGTVTTTTSTSFGTIDDRAATAEVEIRASWTPLLNSGNGLADHLEAWQDMLREIAGLPENDSVLSLTNRIAVES